MSRRLRSSASRRSLSSLLNPHWRPYAATLAIAVVTANLALVQVPKQHQ